jgi:hypothetical protein
MNLYTNGLRRNSKLKCCIVHDTCDNAISLQGSDLLLMQVILLLMQVIVCVEKTVEFCNAGESVSKTCTFNGAEADKWKLNTAPRLSCHSQARDCAPLRFKLAEVKISLRCRSSGKFWQSQLSPSSTSTAPNWSCRKLMYHDPGDSPCVDAVEYHLHTKHRFTFSKYQPWKSLLVYFLVDSHDPVLWKFCQPSQYLYSNTIKNKKKANGRIRDILSLT